MTFSPNGTTLAAGAEDKAVTLWDLTTSDLSRTYLAAPGPVERVAWSPDGTILASGIRDGKVSVWDPATAQPFGLPLEQTDPVYSVAFSPGGDLLASGDQSGNITLYDMRLESWQARACDIANRNLTLDEWQRYLGDEPYRKTCPKLP